MSQLREGYSEGSTAQDVAFPIIFMHIPKTAGTSFRMAAIEYFGQDKVVCDYGVDRLATSKVILDMIQGDGYCHEVLLEYMVDNNIKILIGHFGYNRYRKIWPSKHFACFVRNPIQRVISHYFHRVRDKNIKDTLEVFAKELRRKNMQWKMTRGVGLEDYGFIGIVERYQESLELFNHAYGTGLVSRMDNLAPTPCSEEKLTISRAEIAELNQHDMSLYENALLLFESRWRAYSTLKQSLPAGSQ